jgi:hypothetical protein
MIIIKQDGNKNDTQQNGYKLKTDISIFLKSKYTEMPNQKCINQTILSSNFLSFLCSNSMFSQLLDGTAVKQAVDMGKTGDTEKCSSLYAKCPVSKENLVKVIASLLPA